MNESKNFTYKIVKENGEYAFLKVSALTGLINHSKKRKLVVFEKCATNDTTKDPPGYLSRKHCGTALETTFVLFCFVFRFASNIPGNYL